MSNILEDEAQAEYLRRWASANRRRLSADVGGACFVACCLIFIILAAAQSVEYYELTHQCVGCHTTGGTK